MNKSEKMKINRLMRLLLLTAVLSTVMLSGCKKVDDPNPDFSKDKGEFKDSRDGRVYKWIKTGNKIWMAENVVYKGSDIKQIIDDNKWVNNSAYDGWCYYENNSSYDDIYGVLYQWEAAKVACPSGWHLPIDEEWKELEMYLGMSQSEVDITGNRGTDEGSKLAGNTTLWTDSTLVTNLNFGTSGFSALPGGFCDDNSGTFSRASLFGYWWSATESDSGSAYSRNLGYDNSGIFRNDYSDKSSGFSVRCIRD